LKTIRYRFLRVLLFFTTSCPADFSSAACKKLACFSLALAVCSLEASLHYNLHPGDVQTPFKQTCLASDGQRNKTGPYATACFMMGRPG
jgi:hypothetical protein